MQTRVITSVLFSKLKPSAVRNATTTRYGHVYDRLLRSSTGRPADPAVHSTDDPMGPSSAIHSPEEAYKDMEAKGQRDPTPVKDKDPFVSSKAPLSSSPQLKSSVADQPIQPHMQQKRSNSTVMISCSGLDAWSSERDDGDLDRREERKEREEDDKEFFSHRKASPLSEIEVADTRKPVNQATDGGSDVGYDGGGGGVVMFREEQRVSAEETMRRAMEMWRETAARGDPMSPHGRVLRTLRGEDW